MRRITAVVALTLIWLVLSDVYTPGSIAAGVLAAAAVLWWLAVPIVPMQSVRFETVGAFFLWVGRSLHLLVFFLWKMFLSNVRVTAAVFSREAPRPGIIRMPIPDLTPRQMTILSLLIGLTPGTMVVGITPDHKALYIHCLDAEDEDGTLYASRRFAEMVPGVIPW